VLRRSAPATLLTGQIIWEFFNKQNNENLKCYFEQDYCKYVQQIAQNHILNVLFSIYFLNKLLNNLARLTIRKSQNAERYKIHNRVLKYIRKGDENMVNTT